MAVLTGTTKDSKELIVMCKCGCDEGLRIIISEPEDEYDDYAFMSYLSGKFYIDQVGVFGRFKEKCKKIWHIIRNKDHYYSDVVMSKEDFKLFKEYINQFGE